MAWSLAKYLMRYAEIIHEMAMPDASLLAGVFWHGTRDETAAKSIMQYGLDPDATKIKYGEKQSEGRPVANQVYITHDANYSLAYAGYNGFMFEIPGNRLSDVHPDEDSVGELVGVAYLVSIGRSNPKMASEHFDRKASDALLLIARKLVSKRAIEQCAEGDTGFHTRVGKKLVSHLPDWLKVVCANEGHVGHSGRLMPARCWRVPARYPDSPWFIPEDKFFADRKLIWTDPGNSG